jgi:hypothetical protein
MRRLPIVLFSLLAACAPAAQTRPDGPAPAEPTTMAAPAGGIMGSYTVTLAASDLPAGMPPQAQSRAVGTWGLAFHEGNHFVVTHEGRQVIEGPYRAVGDRLMFATGESGPYACNTPATYTWRTNNRQTTFTPVGADPCPGRALALTTRPYTRAP